MNYPLATDTPLKGSSGGGGGGSKGGNKDSQLDSRYKCVNEFIENFRKQNGSTKILFEIYPKQFNITTINNKTSLLELGGASNSDIYKLSKDVWDKYKKDGTFKYKLDGLIYTPKSKPVAWKPINAVSLEDITSGYRAYGASSINILLSPEATMLTFQDLGVLMLLSNERQKIVETEVVMFERNFGISKIYSSWIAIWVYLTQTLLLCIAKISMPWYRNSE